MENYLLFEKIFIIFVLFVNSFCYFCRIGFGSHLKSSTINAIFGGEIVLVIAVMSFFRISITEQVDWFWGGLMYMITIGTIILHWIVMRDQIIQPNKIYKMKKLPSSSLLLFCLPKEPCVVGEIFEGNSPIEVVLRGKSPDEISDDEEILVKFKQFRKREIYSVEVELVEENE